MKITMNEGVELPPVGAHGGNEGDADEELVQLETELSLLEMRQGKGESDLVGETIINEMLCAMWDARYLGSLLALLGLLIGYQLTIAPYQGVSSAESSLEDVELWKIRPMLTEEEQYAIHLNTMNAETEFTLPLPSYDTIKLRFHSAVTLKGSHQPPEMFYNGVTFGLTEGNSHNLDYHRHRDLMYSDMYEDLRNMRPVPTSIMARSSQFNVTGWYEKGYAVYFSYKDLERQGKLSSDKLQPWKRVLEDVLLIARNYHQVCITVWYPHEFGRPSKDEDLFRDQNHKDDPEYDEHLYQTVLQQVIPTRTGMASVKSIVPVWMSAINSTAPPERSPDMYLKEWDEDDHWSHYLPGGKRWYNVTSIFWNHEERKLGEERRKLARAARRSSPHRKDL